MSGPYSACDIDSADPRKTKLKTLVLDMTSGDVREYGCDVTKLKPGGRPKIDSWFFAVKLLSTYSYGVCSEDNGSVWPLHPTLFLLYHT